MDDYRQANRRRWDELTPLHAGSAFYDVAGFLAGGSSLKSIEVEELGDVAGRSLLHLQCHFGLDTLSWARRGARVTGVDFSEAAVARAKALAAEAGLPAEFACSTVEDLPAVLGGTYDIVFTSYGVLCWLPDLRPWARTVAHFLRPGGTFYMVEIHPFTDVFDDGPDATDFRVRYPYFHAAQPLAWEAQGSYADRSATVVNKVSYVWSHPLGDVVTALTGAGLRLEFLHEFPQCVYPRFPWMRQDADGWWRQPPGQPAVPLLFSLRARRDG
jgi:2-polyprenyl-3-methyl-5-hydroxy-6-metoxy-1,4-benzoquinol methylase